MSNDDYIAGAHAAQSYYRSHGYGYIKDVRAEDAIKLFLPNVTEYMTQVSSPLPKPRQNWIKGFKEEQRNILNNDN